MLLVVAVVVGVATLLYWLGKRQYGYWLARGLPQPPTIFGFGHFKDAYLGRRNYGLIIDDIYRAFPKADGVGMYEFFTPKLLVRSPELIKKVMVSDFSSFHDNEFYVKESLDPYLYQDPFCLRGDEWKPGRASIIPLLTFNRMKELYPTIKDVIPRLFQYADQQLGKDIEVKEFATLFTMDTISSCVFGISSNCFTNPGASFRKMGDILMKEQFQRFWQVIILARLPKLRDILGFRSIPKSVSDFIEGMVLEVMEYREKTKTSRNDLMQYLINHKSGSDLKECLGIATTFFLEGFETASMVASSALYELTLNTKIQDTLRDEIDSTFKDSTDIDIDQLWKLPYLDKVIKETMRKHVVLFSLQKLCTKDTTLEMSGRSIDINTGTKIFIPLYSIHNDPEYYPDPEMFDPERFSEENVASRPAYTYLPFGEGPRICVGYRLGLIQVKLFIACILSRYLVTPTGNFPTRLTYDEGAALVTPKEQLYVRLDARK